MLWTRNFLNMLTAGCISNIKTIAAKNEEQEAFTVRVLGIYRYIVDKSFPILDRDFTDAFDIVITDGRYKTKCLLQTSLNSLVYGHKLRLNSVIKVTECTLLIDEESLEQAPLIILQIIEILDLAPDNSEETQNEIEFCENATQNETQELPLAASRGYYLPLWNDVDYFGSKWFSDPELKPSNPITNAITVADLDSFWKVLPRPFPALIGRIVSKSRLNHYGKAMDEKRKYPYQAYLELEDRTGTVSVCIWSSFCVLLYNYLHVGDIVTILNYRVTRKFSQRSNAVYNTSPAASIEISVNPTNPTAEVYKLASNELGPMWKLPTVPYRFIDRKSLSNYSSGLICDIVGTVMFVSRDFRERKASRSSFWASKWVHLQDGTSSMPIILHLYACSQPEVFESIAAGNVLVCARMLLKIEAQDSKHQRFCFLTTTRESQLYVLKKPSDANNKPFTGSDVVNEAIRWRQTEKAKQLLRRSCSGGYFNFPPLPHTLELYKRTFPSEKPMDLITTVNLGFILKELHFREHVRLHVQGVVVALEFVHVDCIEGTSLQSSGEVTSSQLCETQSSNKNSGGSSSVCLTNQSSNNNSGPSTSQHSESSTDSSQSGRRNYHLRTRNFKNRQDSESESEDQPSDEVQGRIKTKYGYIPRRLNPKRKCKKVDPKSLKLVRINTRARQVSTEDEAPSKKRKARKRLSHPPKKVRRKAAPKNKNSTDLAVSKGKEPKGDQLPEKSDKGLSEFSDSEASNSVKSSRAEKHYPFRVLDQTWKEIAPGHPFLGLSQPSIHENTLPTLCSRGLSDVKVVPTADRQGFVNTEGYWRLLISGLNRRAAISAIFLPQSPDRGEGDSEEPTDGVFLSALATGAFTNWYPLETLLNRASEELKGRRSVFVLDVYSHGQDKAEVIINRAY